MFGKWAEPEVKARHEDGGGKATIKKKKKVRLNAKFRCTAVPQSAFLQNNGQRGLPSVVISVPCCLWCPYEE